MSRLHYKVLIVGGGTGGITVAAQLLRKTKRLDNEIAIVEPSDKHYYQPLWTLVGAGEVDKKVTERDEASVMPDGAIWIQDAADRFLPEENYIVTSSGKEIGYDYLVLAVGLQIDWGKVKGLQEHIGKNAVCSNYSFEYAESTWENIKNFKGGTAIFTAPSTPIKCGGAPQKTMYLAEDYFRKSGVRSKSEVVFASAGTVIFGVEKYAETLTKIIHERNIQTRFKHNLVEIDGNKKEGVFEELDNKTSLPTSKTGAAIRKQAPVLVSNLLSQMQGEPLNKQYNGYTSCPLITGYGRLVLAEFDYDSSPEETFPFDQSKERFSMYLLKKEVLPIFYWDGMLKGLM